VQVYLYFFFKKRLILSKKKQKYYTVWLGKQSGVYESWEECEEQVKGVDGAKYKSFATREEADEALSEDPAKHITPAVRKSVRTPDLLSLPLETRPVMPSLSVDGACSGNPGTMEYQGVDTATKRVIFHFGPAPGGTNNIAEFLAIVHVLALLKKQAAERPADAEHLLTLPVYSDSRTALAWVKKRKCATKLAETEENKPLFELVQRAENWLAVNTYRNPLLKWNTELWGEIPADFGRK